MTFWSGKRVLVTGGGGFAGSAICRSLAKRDAKVSAMVTDSEKTSNLTGIVGVRTVVGDVNDSGSMLKCTRGMDYVFHSAAKVQIEDTRKFPQSTLVTNIVGTFNVAQAAKLNGVKRMLHVSTCHIYGNQPEKNLPLNEKAEPNPHDIYAVSKVSSESVLKPLMEDGLEVVITRAFNHFGPGQVGDFFVPKTIRQILRGEIPRLGNPTPTRDYSYISDIAEGYVLCMEKGRPGEIYHLSSGKETTIGEMYECIAAACGKDGAKAKWADSRKGDMNRSFGDSTKARKELGWKPKVSLKEGMDLTVDWWRKNPSLWRK